MKHVFPSSWGENWGINGYMKIAKDRNNHCSIASHASFPNIFWTPGGRKGGLGRDSIQWSAFHFPVTSLRWVCSTVEFLKRSIALWILGPAHSISKGQLCTWWVFMTLAATWLSLLMVIQMVSLKIMNSNIVSSISLFCEMISFLWSNMEFI